MLQAFVFDNVAVLVSPWHEPAEPPERGTRVEVRLLVGEPRRGSPSAAQRVVIDDPVFRADLFDQMDAPPGNLRSAHFHPNFEGVEPSDRFWRDEIKRDPTGWLAAELGDLRRVLERGGVDVSDAPWVEADADALRDAIPAIVTAVEATWDAVRAAPV
jgi:hypothetical protein